MKKLKAFWDGLLRALPHLWAMLWISIITVGSVTLLIVTIKWLLQSVGVM